MASGSVPLLEAAKAGSDVLKAGVVETIVRESPVAEMIPWMPIAGNALKHEVEENLPDPEFRDVNETYSRSWGTDTEHFWGTTILGGEVFVDNYLIKVRGNVYSVKAKQYKKFAKAMALTLDKYTIDGTGTAKDYKGVNALIDEGFGQEYTPNANGGALTLDDLDIAHDQLRTGHADAMWLNRTLRRKITKLARESVSGVALIDVGTDVFGRQVTTWNDVPLKIIGMDKDGNEILDFDETCGSSNECSSIYLVRYGEDHVTGLMGLGGSFEVRDFGETESAPGHLGRIEFYPGLAIFDRYAIVRYQGITNA